MNLIALNQRIFLLFLILRGSVDLAAQNKYEPTWPSIDSRPVPTWFTDAKFGIFIHWGVYSVPAWAPTSSEIPVYSKYAEWYWYRMNENSVAGELFRDHHKKVYGENFRYQDFAGAFKAENFNPDEWAELFVNAGAKYIVLTSKHHEGFTLWPSTHSWNWNSVDIGPHRDLAGDLSKAVISKGLRMGFYYSLYEWYNPLYQSNLPKYVDEHMIPQMKDLIVRYQPDVFWTDGEWEYNSADWKSAEFLSWLYNESPVKDKVVVNDRWGKETRGKHGGFYTTEYDLVFDENTADKTIEHPWEECRGIGNSFGYNRAEKPEHYASSQQLIHMLIEKVSRGGNLLLDIGPTADGRIPVIMQQRLSDIGAWLKINGEAIYGTTTWSGLPMVNQGASVFYTRKGNNLYVLLSAYPDKEIQITGVKKTGKVSLLGYSGKISWNNRNKNLTITPPVLKPGMHPGNYAWVFKLENAL